MPEPPPTPDTGTLDVTWPDVRPFIRRWRFEVCGVLCAGWGAGMMWGFERWGPLWLALTLVLSTLFLLLGGCLRQR